MNQGSKNHLGSFNTTDNKRTFIQFRREGESQYHFFVYDFS